MLPNKQSAMPSAVCFASMINIGTPMKSERHLKPGMQLTAARTAMADAAFAHERLTAAVSRLRQRLAEVQASEDQARRLAHYRDLEQVRDQLAVELRAFYPAFALKLAALLTRIAANDQAIAHVNTHAKPNGLPPLLSAELVARDMTGFVNRGFATPQLLEELRLPAFAASAPIVICGRHNVSEGDDPCLHLQSSSAVLPLMTIPSCATVRSSVSRCCCAMDLMLTQEED